MLKTRLSILLFCVCAVMNGQTETPARDKFTLLTKPYHERSLQLYRGQLQGNAGYLFGVRTKLFDGEGHDIHTKNVISETHRFSWDIKYGITDFLEIETGAMFAKTNVLSLEEIYHISDESVAYIETLDEHRGLTDWYIGAALRLPREYEHFDISVGGGVFLPTAAYKTKEPRTIWAAGNNQFDDPREVFFNYHRKYPNGTGIPVFSLSAAVKFGMGRFSFQGNGRLLFPAKEGVNLRWREVVDIENNTSFYVSKEYGWLPNRTLNVDAALHYQVNGWLDVHLGGAYFHAAGGWTEYYEQKYAALKEQLIAVTPGFSIQVSPNLTFYETTTFPVAGRNTDGLFQVSVTASFNLFPFFKDNVQ